jgi:hypothetical protein
MAMRNERVIFSPWKNSQAPSDAALAYQQHFAEHKRVCPRRSVADKSSHGARATRQACRVGALYSRL